MWQVQELQRQQRAALEEARQLRADAQPLEAPATYSQVRTCINRLAHLAASPQARQQAQLAWVPRLGHRQSRNLP